MKKCCGGSGSFTILELMIVLVIIGILCSLGLPEYARVKEKSADNLAFTDLKTLHSAEKIHNIEMGSYYPSSGVDSTISNINNELKTSLRSDSARLWNYQVSFTGCVQSTRNGGDGRSWFLQITVDGDPSSGTCP